MRILTFAAFAVLFLGVSAIAQSKAGLEGVWKLTEVTQAGPNGGTQQVTQPSMYLFTKKHYSVIYVASDKPRPLLDRDSLDKATADQLRDVYVNSFIANAGTYEFKAGKLTIHPMVAKSPSYMQPGNFSTMSVKTDGKILTLVSESTNNGPVTNATTFKLTRIE